MYAASSPLAVHRPSNGGALSSSFKRTTSSARGGPKGSVHSLQASGLNSAVESGLSTGQLFAHFSLSGSRRNVSSSPTEGGSLSVRTSGPSSRPAPHAVTVGFSVPDETPVSPQQQPGQSRAARCGLLSRCLASPLAPERNHGPENPFALQGSSPFAGSAGASYFPNVDKTLLRDLQERHDVFHSELVCTAYMLAAKAHEEHTRRDGSSQLSHCVMTSLLLADLGLDAETVAAGLLHDVLRYNPNFRSQMEEFMPTSVVQLVDRVTTITEISHLYRNNKDALGDERMRRMLLAMEDVKAVLIKLACRVHNMRTISALPRDKQIALAQETLDVFSVVANRLGMWSLKADLEDLAFSVLHPEEYDALRSQVARRQDPDALESTIHTIKASLDARGVQYEDISGRPKNLYGIWLKMRAGQLTDLSQVYDVTALRVVVTNKHDCYVALRCIQEVYRTMPGRSKDYIKKEKKANGYQSLHETIYGEGSMPMEVQIRTHKMHYIAEYGFAAHWKYKEKLSNEDEWLDKEVQYKKWLTTHKLGVHDKKVRAAGAPPQETALKSLGMHLIDGSGAGVDPFLQHDRFRLQAPAKQTVSVVLQTQDSIESREFPAGYLASQLVQELGVEGLPGYVVTVNQRLPAPGCVLQSGDLIQVVQESRVLARPAAAAPQPASSLTRELSLSALDLQSSAALPLSKVLPSPVFA